MPDLTSFWVLAALVLLLSRFGLRQFLRQSPRLGTPRVPVLIYGAGEAGYQLADAMRISGTYQPVGFADDDRALHHRRVAGLPVLAPETLPQARARLGFEQIILAAPSAPPARRQALLARLALLGLPVRTLPTMAELAHGRVTESALREVDVADLLGRRPVAPLPELFARCVQGRTVLVTGAGGSIGSELCRQLVTQQPRELILLDHSEYALYAIEHELRDAWPQARLRTVLASVCDADRIEALLREQRVHTIYHAAAYKHVPMVEANPAAGLRNNVEGSLVVARAAACHGVETCVLVSTDKAVRPTNVMGASKRISELVFQAYALQPSSRTTFSMVRFGNVLGSSGSVVPLFRAQIARGGPVTLTHPEVIRYFMLIPEAAQLVIQAGAMARGGEVFVLDMGEPVRVLDLARTMIRLSGRTERTADQPDGDIEIQITGLRPGEKLYEELLIGECAEPSTHPRILRSQEPCLTWGQLEPLLERLRAACSQRDAVAIRQTLLALVPEYVAPSTPPVPPSGMPGFTLPALGRLPLPSSA